MKHRWSVILLGYFAASLVAGTILIVAELRPWRSTGVSGDVVWLSLFSFVTYTGFLILPALVVIAIAEVLWVRHPIAYAFLGAIGLLFLGWYAGVTTFVPAMFRYEAIVAAVIAGAGIVAGVVYWSIAGRNAGAAQRPSPM